MGLRPAEPRLSVGGGIIGARTNRRSFRPASGSSRTISSRRRRNPPAPRTRLAARRGCLPMVTFGNGYTFDTPAGPRRCSTCSTAAASWSSTPARPTPPMDKRGCPCRNGQGDCPDCFTRYSNSYPDREYAPRKCRPAWQDPVQPRVGLLTVCAATPNNRRRPPSTRGAAWLNGSSSRSTGKARASGN